MKNNQSHWLLLVPLASACATVAQPTYFQPTERVLAATPTGEKAAIYDVATASGTVAAVKIWSNGVDEGEIDGRQRALAHVGIEITNTGDSSLLVKASDFRIDGGHVQPVLSTGASALEVPPTGVRRVDAYFELAAGVRPQNVRTFAFHWSLDSEGHGYTQSTVFVIDPSLAVTPFVKRWRPAGEQHRHTRVVIRDGLVVGN